MTLRLRTRESLINLLPPDVAAALLIGCEMRVGSVWYKMRPDGMAETVSGVVDIDPKKVDEVKLIPAVTVLGNNLLSVQLPDGRIVKALIIKEAENVSSSKETG